MWEDLMTKFFVGLVNIALREDVEGGADESKEGGIEVDGAVRVQGHVHGDKTLEVHMSVNIGQLWGRGSTLQATR